MRILLIQSYLGRLGVSDQLVFPIGLSCVATALEAAGHEPWIVDLNAGDDEPLAILERALERHQPEVVGLSIRNIDSTMLKAPIVFHTFAKPTLETIRRVAPHAPVMVGGPGFTQASRGLMERYDFDFGVLSEAEETVVRLVENLRQPEKVPGVYHRKDGALLFNGAAPLPDFAALPFPKRHFVDWDLYRLEEGKRRSPIDIGVEASRGCPARCAYCNYPTLNGRVPRFKPAATVVEEIAYLQERFGIERFTFTDSRFNLHWPHAQAICEGILERGIRIQWSAWLGPDKIDAQRLELMREAGCVRVGFSADGLHQASLDRMLKGMTRADIDNSIRAVRKVPGLKASWSFFCTPPSTSHREQLALLKTYARIHGTMPRRGRMLLGWCRVEEGTAFERIAYEDGVLQPGVDLLPDTDEALAELFYVAPGFEGWSRFWNGFLDTELKGLEAARKAAARLRGLKGGRPPGPPPS